MVFPQKMEIKAPRAIKGPKGMISLFPFVVIIIITPTKAPKKKPRKRESKMSCQPKKAPSIAASLTSPPPMASFLKR